MIDGLQQADARTLQGLVSHVALGMLSYRLYTAVNGKPFSGDPAELVKEGISRSGVLGWFDEGNGIMSKLTSGKADVYRLIGAGKPLSRFESRSPFGALLGPTAGKIADISSVIGATFRGDFNAGDTHRLRRTIPFQNLTPLSPAMDAVEGALNRSFGIPAQMPKSAT